MAYHAIRTKVCNSANTVLLAFLEVDNLEQSCRSVVGRGEVTATVNVLRRMYLSKLLVIFVLNADYIWAKCNLYLSLLQVALLDNLEQSCRTVVRARTDSNCHEH